MTEIASPLTRSAHIDTEQENAMLRLKCRASSIHESATCNLPRITLTMVEINL